MAAILHDVVEDTPMELADVQKMFGAEVATLVDGVTKIGTDPLFLAGGAAGGECPQNAAGHVAGYPRHHHQTGRPAAQYAHQRLPGRRRSGGTRRMETMDIYAPLAHRLGIRAVKEELEDISLRYSRSGGV